MSDFITNIDILDESKECFLTYAEEVLTDRAIPSAEDGLLSVHRKILWTMADILKLDNKAKYKKSASVVGSTLASSYFHGDASCYGALCKMAQPYLMRYPLIDGEGNLGTQEGNGMEAAARYTNCKPSIYADLMFNDFKKDVVPTKETYNGEYYEPVVLPSIFPNAIVNGKEAIGISMSHCSLPHNLTEVCDGIIEYIKNPAITTKELMEYIKGPDFPLGNVCINSKDIRSAFETGHSTVSLKVRGDYKIDGQKITFTSIPYRTYRDKIKEQIKKNIEVLDEYIDDFSDFSNVGQNKLVFKVKRGIAPEQAVLKLFALTDLQTTLSYNMNYIVNGTPKLCSMLELIEAYYIHQSNILISAATYDREKALARIHIIEGLLKAVDKINEVIELIKTSKDKSEACDKLISFLSVDKIQAEAILDMKLARLTKINKQELVDEKIEKEAIVAECNKIIEDKIYRDEKLISKIESLKKKYGDKRRTELLNIEVPKEDKEIEEVIPEDVVVIMTQSGYIKRVPKASFKTQKRNGKGVKSEDDAILGMISTNTVDALMLFSNEGKMYRLVVDNIPSAAAASKGVSISGLITLSPHEKIIAITSLNRQLEYKYVVFFTKNGLVKKTLLEEYTKVKRSTGIVAISIKEGDSLANVVFMNEEDIVIITKNGMSIHFNSADINAIGRATAGVKGIKLGEDDEVVIGLPVYDNSNNVAIVTENGTCKKLSMNDLPLQLRSGKGVSISSHVVCGAAFVGENDNVLIIGKPNSICISATEIPKLGRTAIGNIVIKESKITSMIKL